MAIALSGGVDSAAAAAILKSQGYDCLGIFLKFWHEAENEEENKCCSAQATDDARRVAQKLGFRTPDWNQFAERIEERCRRGGWEFHYLKSPRRLLREYATGIAFEASGRTTLKADRIAHILTY